MATLDLSADSKMCFLLCGEGSNSTFQFNQSFRLKGLASRQLPIVKAEHEKS